VGRNQSWRIGMTLKRVEEEKKELQELKGREISKKEPRKSRVNGRKLAGRKREIWSDKVK